MGRRRFIRHAAGFGFASATLGTMTQAELAEAMTGDEVTYVAYTKDGGETAIYDTMARDRWNRIKAVQQASDQLRAQYKPEWGPTAKFMFSRLEKSPFGIGVSVDLEQSYGRDGEVRRERAVSKEKAERVLPDAVSVTVGEGQHAETIRVPIRVQALESHRLGCDDNSGTCQDKDENYTDIPGGVPMRDLDEDAGSMCSDYYHPDYGHGWVGAGHVNNENTGGEIVYTGRGSTSTSIATCKVAVDWSWDEDYSFYREDYSPNTDKRIAEADQSGSKTHEVNNVTARSTIQSDIDGGVDNYYCQGASGCRNKGGPYKENGSGAKFYADAEAGDSGGIIFKDLGFGDASIAANITAEFGSDTDGDGCPDNTGGVQAVEIEDYMNGAWGTT